jgi:hypothetical protein
MSSTDPDDLKQELESIDFSGDPDLLREFREEARVTVDKQIETLNDIDTKASRILRVNIVLIGVLVSVASIVAQNGSSANADTLMIEPYINLYMMVGVGSLILSTAFAAITYTASELDVGLSSENLKTLLDADFPKDKVEELVVKNYIVRINFNRSTNIRNIPLIQATIILIIAAIASFALGLYRAAIGSVPYWVLLVTLAILAVVIVASGFYKQLKRAFRDLIEWR